MSHGEWEPLEAGKREVDSPRASGRSTALLTP